MKVSGVVHHHHLRSDEKGRDGMGWDGSGAEAPITTCVMVSVVVVQYQALQPAFHPATKSRMPDVTVFAAIDSKIKADAPSSSPGHNHRLICDLSASD